MMEAIAQPQKQFGSAFEMSYFRFRLRILLMPHFDTCLGILRRLIVSNGDLNAIRLAERAIDDYLEATPAAARKSGLRLLQQGVLTKHKVVVGVQRAFAENVNAYIEKKLAEE